MAKPTADAARCSAKTANTHKVGRRSNFLFAFLRNFLHRHYQDMPLLGRDEDHVKLLLYAMKQGVLAVYWPTQLIYIVQI